MGMFDDITFRYRMPDGFDGDDYQSKDLDCSMDRYEVTPDGKLVRTYSSGYPDDIPQPLGDVRHEGVLNIYTSVGRKWHEYDLVFKSGTLISIRCNQTDSELLFEPRTTPQVTLQEP